MVGRAAGPCPAPCPAAVHTATAALHSQQCAAITAVLATAGRQGRDMQGRVAIWREGVVCAAGAAGVLASCESCVCGAAAVSRCALTGVLSQSGEVIAPITIHLHLHPSASLCGEIPLRLSVVRLDLPPHPHADGMIYREGGSPTAVREGAVHSMHTTNETGHACGRELEGGSSGPLLR